MHHLFWTSNHNGGVVAVPCCNFSIDCSRPACLSLIRHTSGRAATTWTFTRSRNQYQLSKFSFSTNANASGTIWLLQSTPIAVSIWPLYLPVRNVPSMQITGRQHWNTLTQAHMQKKARCRMLCPLFTAGTRYVSQNLPGFLAAIWDNIRVRLSYDASYVPNRISNTLCLARHAFK